MNRYFRAASSVLLGAIKTIILMIERGSKVKIKLPVLISANTELSVDRGGELYIGKRSTFRSGCRLLVRKSGSLSIGNNCYMNTGCILSSHNNISIGNNVEFGPNVLVYDQDHDFRVKGGLSAKKFKTSPVSIGNNVWVGANSIILRGTQIGDNSVIGAGSIVKGIVPSNSILLQKRETTFSIIEEL